jgi:hypothetical protein
MAGSTKEFSDWDENENENERGEGHISKWHYKSGFPFVSPRAL